LVATLVVVALAALAGCGDGSGPTRRTDVPEPAVAPAPVALADLPGRIVPLTGGGEPEGLAWDTTTGTIAVAVRNPGAVVLVDAATGAERARIPLGGAARHLQLAAAGGPVLVPAENNDRLYRVALPDGAVSADTPVGRQPHAAAPAAGGRVFVGDELADTVHVVQADGSSRVVAAPAQPGGVASSPDGSVVVVVGVRGRRIAAFAPDGRRLGETDCGVGPSHVRAGAPGSGLFYVADTQGDAVLVFRAGPDGIAQVGRVRTEGDAPYGLAFDPARSRLYVTLTGTNQLRSYRVDGTELVADRVWSTPRQPNDVAVDAATGRVVVAGTADGVLQFIEP
jgi:DNA-binding beta-propeller fold protein YncE